MPKNIKKCSSCHEEKSFDQFYPSKITALGIQSTCRDCDIIRARQRRRDPLKRPLTLTQERVHRARTRDLVFEAYGGYKCVCCGETEPKFLSIDHINNDGAKHKKKTNSNLYRWLKKNDYPSGFQVLCMNCNCGKYRNGGICPHKTSGVIHAA